MKMELRLDMDMGTYIGVEYEQKLIKFKIKINDRVEIRSSTSTL